MIPLSGPDPAEKDVRLDHLLVETVKSARDQRSEFAGDLTG
jgi:hypothetical protein